MASRLVAIACSLASSLGPEGRRRLVLEVLEAGYTGRELARLMGVSPPAVSRYVHGTLAPSAESLCRAFERLAATDEELAVKLLAEALRALWGLVRAGLEELAARDPGRARELLEEVADAASELLAALPTPRPPRGGPLYP